MPRRPKVIYACPRNGELVMCEVDKVPFPHRREELLTEGARVPRCETHQVKLLPRV
jgi:hypothetical protein